MMRIVLPFHLRTLAHIKEEVVIEVQGPPTLRSALDALEARLFQMKALEIFGGAVAGLLAAALLAFLWSRYGHHVDLKRFLQVTAVFLLVFVVQLVIYGVHELAEGNAFPHSAAIHDATEVYGPDGIYGKWLNFGLVAVPLAWLLISWLVGRISQYHRSPDAPQPL